MDFGSIFDIKPVSMRLSTLTIVEIILFNLSVLFIYQPDFIFGMLGLDAVKVKIMKKVFTALGVMAVCALFGWSFFFGATLFIYKQSLL